MTEEHQEEQFVKVVVELPEPDLGVSGERLWAVQVADDLYEIRSSPWHSRDINWGDVVKAVARNENEWPIFVAVVRRSGHHTIHVYVPPAARDRRQEMLARLNELGATYENADDRLFALDFEPGVAVGPAIAYLEELKARDLADFRVSNSE
jgi:hypothetical protein